jgi:anthranilate/para-aminobenzoate synthase component I
MGSLRVRDIPVAPDPLALARALHAAGAPGVALLHTADRAADLPRLDRFSYVGAEPDRRSERLDPLEDDPGFVAGREGIAPRWIGVVPYEARRAALERPGWAPPEARPVPPVPAPVWYRYPALVCVDHARRRVFAVGRDLTAVERLARLVRAARPAPEPDVAVSVAEDEPPARHAERIAAALELIARGDLYQVNLARRLRVGLCKGDALALYGALARRAPSPFGCCLDLGGGLAVCSTSPELLLLAHARDPDGDLGVLFTAPIKGTRPRGANPALDAALAGELDADPKERAELVMILDVERNDLGRVAEAGSVGLVWGPRVVTHPTVHHRVALLRAHARLGATRTEVLSAMVPSGSVTGAPKVRAMEVIAALEPARRGLYTGGIGFVAHDGSVTLSMAIRTAVLADDEGEYWSGGGIVADSDPAREVEETRWKALQLLGAAACGAQPPSPPSPPSPAGGRPPSYPP